MENPMRLASVVRGMIRPSVTGRQSGSWHVDVYIARAVFKQSMIQNP